jgi:hypothetical protein
MLRLCCIVLFIAFGPVTAHAESIYTDKMGRTLRMYYSWTSVANGPTKLHVQLVNYASITWTNIIVNCDVKSFAGLRSGSKEIPIDSPVFDFELSKNINDIDVGQILPRAKLECEIIRASQGEATLKTFPRQQRLY